MDVGYRGLVYSNCSKLLFTIGELFSSKVQATVGTGDSSLSDTVWCERSLGNSEFESKFAYPKSN